MTARCDLYRVIYLSDLGYVVFRACFDEHKCSLETGARAHRVASFVCEDAATEYCDHRNRLIDALGTDELPRIADEFERLQEVERLFNALVAPTPRIVR